MSRESITIALRGIAANRMRSALTMLGILIGVGSVIILVAVGAGSAAASAARLEALGSNTITVAAGGFGQGNRGGTQARNIQLNDGDLTALTDRSQAPDVVTAVPVVQGGGTTLTASFDGASATPGQTLGTSEAYESVRNSPTQAGAFFTIDDVTNHARVMVAGTTLARNLLGATADPNGLLDQEVKLGNDTYHVVGIMKTKGSNGFQDQDDIALIPYTTMRDLISGNTGTFSQIILQAASPTATTSAQNEAQAILVARHTGTTATSFRILNQASLLATQQANNQTFTVLLGSVAAISLLVGGIGVMNIMLVTVTERTREIGIRKAIGAPRSAIVAQFLVEATMLTFLGGVLGVLGGVAGSHFRIVGIQPVVQLYSVILAVGVAVAVGLFFGIYPATRAASLNPIDALRHE